MMALLRVSLFWISANFGYADLPPGLLASQWSAHMSCESFRSDWFVDLGATGPRYRHVTSFPAFLTSRIPDAVPYTEDTLARDARDVSQTDVTFPEGGDPVCAPNAKPPADFPNPFAVTFRNPALTWSFQGMMKVNYRVCKAWQWSMFFVCIAADGSPLQMTFYNMTCSFSNFTVGIDETVFQQNEACKNYPTPACPSKDVVNMSVYRLGSAAEPLVLDNRDTTDLAATPTILCNWPVDNTSLFTHWSVMARASWGQYGRCHYNGTNYCDAGTGNEVGRQLPQGIGSIKQIGPLQGQCSPNQDSGSWISFPSGGKCGTKQKVGDGGCTWSATRVRSIHAGCLAENPLFRSACSDEVGRGYANPRSVSIIAAAFSSSDPSKGGCPDAAGPNDGVALSDTHDDSASQQEVLV